MSSRSENRAVRVVTNGFTLSGEGQRWRRTLLLATVAVASVWSWSASAQAQTITLGRIGRYSPTASDQDPDHYKYRATRPWWISYADCINNDVFVFPIQLSDASHRLEVWAGNDDCVANRGKTSDRGQCWIVGSAEHLERSITVEVPVRNVVLRDLSNTTIPSDLGSEVCEGSTDSDGNKVTFYFLIEDSGKAVGTGTTWTGGTQGTGFDLVGPPPPSSISIKMGEGQLSLSIGGLTDDTELKSLEAFCVPEGEGIDPGTDVVPAEETDAGTSADGGSEFIPSTTGAAPSACYTPLLVAGKQPPIGYACGKVNKSSGTIQTNTLLDDTTYAVGVAGEDVIGNPGLLSGIQCGTPHELDDFFEVYGRNGGRGGGGFCSASPGASRSSAAAAVLLGMVLAALRVRRTRSRA